MGFQQNLLKWVFCYFIGNISVRYSEKGGGGKTVVGLFQEHLLMGLSCEEVAKGA